jgi:hypothetical protein
MVLLFPTPPDKLVDAAGRPYFLWDTDMTLEEFERRLREAGREGKAYLVGKLMRQAKPDDVFTFVTVDEIVALWPSLERYLGRQRPFWTWLLGYWGCRLDAAE